MAWLFLGVVVALIAFLNLSLLWNRIASRTYVFVPPKNLIRHVFGFYGWPIWYRCMRPVRRLWGWCKRFWASSNRNPAIVLLVIAWGFIGFSVWRFSPDIYELYGKLAKQILEGGQTADEYRGIAIRYFGIIAGAGAVIGYIFATARNIILDNQNKINARAQTTESMVQAIAQIGAFNDGKPNVEVRLGGLYSLQRIMKDSPKDEETIGKIFYAYVRENITRDRIKQADKIEELKKSKGEEKEYLRLPEDIQATLIIISQLNEEWRDRGIKWLLDPQLNLSYTDFSNYFLTHLDVRDTNLEHANFSDTDLHFAQLSGASFHRVNFSGAMFFGADLSNAHLAFANFSDADLTDADLDNANLAFADLSSVVLSQVENLTQKQIEQADSRGDTQLNEDLTRPAHWEKTEQDLEDDYANQEPDWDEYRKRDE